MNLVLDTMLVFGCTHRICTEKDTSVILHSNGKVHVVFIYTTGYTKTIKT